MGLVGEFYLIKPKPASDQYEYATARTADWVEPSEAQTANAWKSALLITLALGRNHLGTTQTESLACRRPGYSMIFVGRHSAAADD